MHPQPPGPLCDDSCPKLTELTPPPPCCANTLIRCYYAGGGGNNNEYAYELRPAFYAPVAVSAPDYDCYDQPPKHRQSYSLDFKLSAIECYYQDGMCRGNQRAVATKYNVHRRQVQKWLQQEEELRSRNESSYAVKQMHAVR